MAFSKLNAGLSFQIWSPFGKGIFGEQIVKIKSEGGFNWRRFASTIINPLQNNKNKVKLTMDLSWISTSFFCSICKELVPFNLFFLLLRFRLTSDTAQFLPMLRLGLLRIKLECGSKSAASIIVNPWLLLQRQDLIWTTNDLGKHTILAGGNVPNVIRALIFGGQGPNIR